MCVELQIIKRSLQQLGVGLFVSGSLWDEIRGAGCEGKCTDVLNASAQSNTQRSKKKEETDLG